MRDLLGNVSGIEDDYLLRHACMFSMRAAGSTLPQLVAKSLPSLSKVDVINCSCLASCVVSVKLGKALAQSDK